MLRPAMARRSRSKSTDEKQIRDAIAQAPAHGLRSDLFLKGGETGRP